MLTVVCGIFAIGVVTMLIWFHVAGIRADRARRASFEAWAKTDRAHNKKVFDYLGIDDPAEPRKQDLN
jgi:hypothetical protein